MNSLKEAFWTYCDRAREHERAGHIDAAWACLEAAHILGQRITHLHAASHWKMMGFGWRTRDRREVRGQITRLLASLVLSRIWVPLGNSGRAHVSPVAPQPIPTDLRQVMREVGVRAE